MARFQPVFRVFWLSATAPAGKTPKTAAVQKPHGADFAGGPQSKCRPGSLKLVLLWGIWPPAQAVYGQTARQPGHALSDAHAATYPGATAWIAAVHEQARNVGEVRTLYGRRRQLPNIYSASDALASEAKRQAVNTVVQGSAADLLKLALVRLHDALPDDVRMLLPVHDSVLLEVPAALAEETQQIVVEAMESTPPGFSVPLTVEAKTGRTWAECK